MKGRTFVKQKTFPTVIRNRMVRQLVLYISLLVSFSLQAQSEKAGITVNDSIQEDSVPPPKPSAFKRAIKKFMNFSDFDTLYISPNRYNYALMATHFVDVWCYFCLWSIFFNLSFCHGKQYFSVTNNVIIQAAVIFISCIFWGKPFKNTSCRFGR